MCIGGEEKVKLSIKLTSETFCPADSEGITLGALTHSVSLGGSPTLLVSILVTWLVEPLRVFPMSQHACTYVRPPAKAHLELGPTHFPVK